MGDELRRRSTGGTTHVSVADAEGGAASMTTSNGEGSGWLLPGTGVMANNMMGEDDLHPGGFHTTPPGQRVASMMAPSMVVDADGRVRLVVGSGGSKRIRTALAQVIAGVVDQGQPLVDAVHAPRLHWDGERLHAEPGWSDEVLSALQGPMAAHPMDAARPLLRRGAGGGPRPRRRRGSASRRRRAGEGPGTSARRPMV